MSGTSMDGVDLAYVEFDIKDSRASFFLKGQKTYHYSQDILAKLRLAKNLSVTEILSLDKELGVYFASSINQFCIDFKLNKTHIDAIASHGHTVHHQPENGFSQQIGCGTTIAINTGMNVINDFRTKDVVLKGQGAPLVPIGDKLLFSQRADSFINLGGFCNLSYENSSQEMKAYDVCPCNLPLNHFALKLGKPFDANGDFAKSGKIEMELFDQLNQIPYYGIDGPKSLGTEFLEETFFPVINSFEIPAEDMLRTITEHIAFQIANQLNENSSKSAFVTGGGANNYFLMERLHDFCNNIQFIKPSKNEIEFKEAIVFAFLGALYLQDIPNSLPSVTGSIRQSVGGVYHKYC